MLIWKRCTILCASLLLALLPFGNSSGCGGYDEPEIFNLFNNQNAITNTWVRDVYTKNQYGIPNYMTTRVFNIKLTARL